MVKAAILPFAFFVVSRSFNTQRGQECPLNLHAGWKPAPRWSRLAALRDTSDSSLEAGPIQRFNLLTVQRSRLAIFMQLSFH
ncbi:MAG: hypothetical protein DME19_05200 [Verrucomicrobia bacterium]|nr:MAG: hypothetical protein DME19_05200 [Verrucomicrobiota bacterium]